MTTDPRREALAQHLGGDQEQALRWADTVIRLLDHGE